MAVLITPNLKLRIADSLTKDAAYNLRRIDALGTVYTVDSAQNVRIKALGSISIEPASPDFGGAGSSTSSVQFNSALLQGLRFDDGFVIQNGSFTTTIQSAAGQATNLVLTLPPTDGGAGQVLTTDGAGVLTWEDSAASALQTQVVTWTVGDGFTKSITHNYGTLAVFAQVVDENGETVETDVSRPDINTITLTRNENPAGSWLIMLIKIT